jgi:protein-tyrosine phosphatase
MIDFHSHILPGIDDGADDIDESIAMARALQAAGFETIHCTPHLIKGCFDADNQAVLHAIAKLQTRLKEENIAIELLPGREYYLDEFLETYLEQPMPLGGTPYIMIEIANNADADFVKESCFNIKRRGFIPMIAHPERCRLFAAQAKPSKSRLWFTGSGNKNENDTRHPLIDYLKDIGCAFQGNFGSFAGMYGGDVRHTANQLRQSALFTHYGTDAHSLKGVNFITDKIE